MLNHTSGLRDWGNVASIAGWPRTTRVYTHAHVLEIVVEAEGAELHAGHAVVLQQHRLQPRGDHRRAGQRQDVPGVHARAAVRAARHDPHLLARRLHAHRQGPRAGLRRARWRVPHRHAVRERLRQRRAADDGRRPAEVERALRLAGRRRRGDDRGAAAGRPLQRRPHARLRARPVRRHLQGAARGLSQRIDRRLQRVPHALSRSEGLRRRALQRDDGARRRSMRIRSRISTSAIG